MSSTLPDTTRARLAAVRVPVESPRGLFARAMAWYSRTYGDVLDNGLVLCTTSVHSWHWRSFERKVDGWDRPTLT